MRAGAAALAPAGRGFEEIALDVQIAKDTWAHLAVTRADGGTIFMRLTDITQHKLASTALATALDRERETTKRYRSFISMVSHQFRTPLAILDSNAQRMLRAAGLAVGAGPVVADPAHAQRHRAPDPARRERPQCRQAR